VSFDAYEIHLPTQELFKHGTRIKLAPQSFRVLQMLLDRRGQLVTREEVQRALWPSDTIVDFDQGRNNAIKKIRDALNDSADTPRYIETLPRLGYRFIGQINEPQINEASEVSAAEAAPAELETRTDIDSAALKKEPVRALTATKITAFVAQIGLASVLLFTSGHHPPDDKVRTSSFDIVPLTSLGNVNVGSFSPDGAQIVFVRGGIWGDIYVKTLSDEKMLRLTTGTGYSTEPVWSPDGQHIAYIHRDEIMGQGKWGVYLISPLGGGNRKIKDIPVGTSGLDWSPDGTLIAYEDVPSGQPGGLWLMSPSGSLVRSLTTPSGHTEDTAPAFSHDGRRIAFLRETSWAVKDIYIVEASGGEPQRLTFENANVGRPVWTADDQKIIFASDTGGSSWSRDLYSVSVSGGKPERLPFSNYDAGDASITRLGDKLSYARCNFDPNIWQLAADSTEPASPFRASSMRVDLDPEFSPDGTKVAFMSDRSGEMAVWTSDPEGNNPTLMTPAWRSGSPRWSPDGTQIAFDSGREGHVHVRVARVEGGQPEWITEGDFDDRVPSWSKDGQWIYFGSLRSGAWEIWRVSPTTKQAIQVTFHGGYIGQASSDGQFVYYDQAQGPWVVTFSKPGIWRVPVGGGTEEMVNANIRQPWHVTAEGIYFADNGAKPQPVIKFFEFATRSVRTVGQLNDSAWGPPNFAVSPDRHTILYTQLDGSNCDLFLVKNGSW